MRRGRRGFTLIELLVVIAIIGVLIAAPAPGRAGSLARRARLLAMRQQSEADRPGAAQLRDAANGSLPPSGEIGSNWYPGLVNAAGPQNFAMKVRILPFLEMQNAYNTVNFAVSAIWNNTNASVVDGFYINQTIRATSKISSYICPSDTNDFPERPVRPGQQLPREWRPQSL